MHFSEETVKISPEVTRLYVVQGDKLELNCIHEYPSSSQEMSAFKKGEIVITANNEMGYTVRFF